METLLREAKEKHPEIPASLKEDIVLEHTPLIRYIVNRIAVRLPSHIDLDDLDNMGAIGLMDVIEKYDPRRTASSRPTPNSGSWARSSISSVHSTGFRAASGEERRLERAYGEVEQRLGRSASEDEVADSLGLQIDKFDEPLNEVRGISLVNLEEIRGTNSTAIAPGSSRTSSRTCTPRPVRVAQADRDEAGDRDDDRDRCRRRAAGDLADDDEDLNMKEIAGSSASPSPEFVRSTRSPCCACARSSRTCWTGNRSGSTSGSSSRRALLRR